MDFDDQEMDFEYGNGECNCDYHYNPRHEYVKTYPYCPMKPVIRTKVPKLKDMTSATVAVSLWKHINILPHLLKTSFTCAKDARCWESFKTNVVELSKQLPIPLSVQEQIGKYIGKVQNEIINWATYHFRSVFINRAKDYIVYNYVGDLIWHSDGTINCVETAKVISKSKTPVVSDDEKCNFLCMYCLEDDMQPMSSVLLNIFQKCVNFDQHPLIHYWSCYFSGELNSIPKYSYEDISLDCFMFRHRYVDNWPAKEYFFDRLSPEEQVTNAKWLIDNYSMAYQKILLKKLNDSQRVTVYIERSEQIIMNYVSSGVNLTDAIETWYEVRNLITRDQFVGLFSSLLRVRAGGRILTEVWISADTDFKHHLFTLYNYEYVGKILNSFQWINDIDFVTSVLKDLNAANLVHATKQFFIDFCETLLSKRENFHWLDRLLDVYLGEDSKQFKEDFVLNSKSIKSLCLKYYSSGQLKSLNDMLSDLFSQMPDRIPEYKRTLLNSPDGISMCINVGFNTNSLNEIIADALPETDFAFELRKKIIFSTPVINKLKTRLAKKDLNGLDSIIDIFLISDQDKTNLKKSLLDEPSQLICDCFCNSEDTYLESLLLWVFKHQNLVDKFKETIPIDGIFDTMLAEACRVIRSCKMTFWDEISFKSLDRFLIWRLGSPSEVKTYKLQRIYSYSEVYVITTLLNRMKRKSSVASQRLQFVMKWFFENDSAEIIKFNETFQRDGIIAQVL